MTCNTSPHDSNILYCRTYIYAQNRYIFALEPIILSTFKSAAQVAITTSNFGIKIVNDIRSTREQTFEVKHSYKQLQNFSALGLFGSAAWTSRCSNFARDIVLVNNRIEEEHVKTAFILCQWMPSHPERKSNINIL
jgi:hypothetical protein